MEALNHELFHLLNARPDSHPLLLWIAEISAVYLIWMLPVLLIVGWLRGSDRLREPLFEAFCAVLMALLASWVIGWLWPYPRPFMMPIGANLLVHDPTPSFPSNHLTIIWTMACSLMLHAKTRRIGRYLLLLGLPVAWARITLGVHFPLDMLGAALLAPLISIVVGKTRPWLVTPIYLNVALRLYRRLFSPLIQRGWVQR